MSNMMVNDRALPAHCPYGCCGGLEEYKVTHTKKRLRRWLRSREKQQWRREMREV